jgi:hypothetical protein
MAAGVRPGSLNSRKELPRISGSKKRDSKKQLETKRGTKMNSNLLRAPSREMASRSDESILLPRHPWKRSLVLALVTLMSVASAFAAPGVQVGNRNMFRPRGMVRSTVPNPVAGGAPLHDYWVADGASGFCRLDEVGPDTAPSNGIVNLRTCYLPGVFEPMDYQVETRGINGSNGYVFVAGINEVTRLEFTVDPLDPRKTFINAATQVSIFNGAASIFANGLPVGRNRAVQSAKLGPDGKLYIIFQGSGDIWRVNNPLSPNFTPAGNTVERVGTSDNGKTLLSIAWVGHDLWMSQAGFLNRIQNADKCNYQKIICQAVLQFGKLQTQEGLASDQFVSSTPNGRWLYWGNGNRVIRYDTLSASNHEIWNQSGFVCAGPGNPCPVSPVPQEYTLIKGLNFIQPETPMFLADGGATADMTITSDPIIDPLPPAIPGPLVRTGRTFLYSRSTTLVPEACTPDPKNPLKCVVTSVIGNDNPSNFSPTWNAARRGVLLLAGVTHPRGLLFLQTNWWVSDKAKGFCRIDQNPITGAAGMSNCFQPFPGFEPGQAAADAPDASGKQNVYIPDISGLTHGINRMKFTPDANGGTLSQTGVLSSGPGTVSAIAIPTGPFNDGAIYFGYLDRGFIEKIGSPATAPTAPQVVGASSKGSGVLSLAFKGNDLYLAEDGPPANTAGQIIIGGQLTVLQSASPDLQRGGARLIVKPLSRLQSPNIPVPQTFTNPAAITVGPTGDRDSCLPPLGVKLSAGIPADPGTAPALYYGSVGVNPADAGLIQLPEVDQYGSICTTEGPWVQDAALDPLLSLNVPLGPVTALGFTSLTDPNAILAIGDDPSVVPAPATAQRSKVGPPTTNQVGQGHVYIVP